MSYKKIMRKIDIEHHKKKLQDFIKDNLDKKMIATYFMLGVKAGIFKDTQTGRVLTDDDQLMFGYYDHKYQYTFRRQSIPRQREAKGVRAMAKMMQNQRILEEQRKRQKESMKGVRLD